MTGQGNELKDTRLHDPVRPAVFAPFVTGDPLIATLGPIARRVSDKTVELRITPAEAALNTWDALHGGALSAWLDMAMYELAKRRGKIQIRG